jgi:hypothetical protein
VDETDVRKMLALAGGGRPRARDPRRRRAVIALATRIGPGVATDPPGPRVFPLALGAAIVVCGLLLGARSSSRTAR